MRKFMFGIAVLTAATVVFAAPAWAGPPMPASGTISGPTACTVAKTAGPNTFVDCTGTRVWTGSFIGTSLPVYTCVIHGPIGLGTSFECQGTSTFTGSVAGCGTGTVLFEFAAQGTFAATASGFDFRNFRETTLPGGTLSVHANLDLSGDGNSYTGEYFC